MTQQRSLLVPSLAATLAVGLSAGAQNLHVVGRTQNDGDLVVLNNVGVGVSTPATKLHVAGTVLQENGNTLQAKNTSGSAETWMWPRWSDNIMYTNFGANGWSVRNNVSTPVMFMNNAGQVGVGFGANTPLTSTFQVNGSMRIGPTNASYPSMNTPGGSQSLNFQSADTDYAYIKGEGIGTPDDGGLGIYLGDDTSAFFRVVNSAYGEIMRAAGTGEVGIGRVPRSGYKLDVAGAIGFGGDPIWRAGVGTGAAALNKNSISVDTIESLKQENGTFDPTLEVFWYNPGATLAVNGAVTAKSLAVSRDGQSECCSGGNYTMSIAEASSSTGHLSTIQFHNAGQDEGYIQLRGPAVGGARRFQFGDHQGQMMGGEFTGSLWANQNLAVGGNSLVNGNEQVVGSVTVGGSVQIGSSIQLVEKPGDNGSASCDTFCRGSQWGGWIGSCVAAFNARTNVPMTCTQTVSTSSGLRCLCARLGAGNPPPPSDPCPSC